ncbi:MAG: sugar phosphate isomerase/epimerase [Acidobacteria bacterium]|nr:sugar phosphate isomerase/epimerase [Acidobacteriota bacterium]
MTPRATRRQFLTSSVGAVIGAGAAQAVSARATVDAPRAAAPFTTVLRIAMIQERPTPQSLADAKAAGFDGIESRIVPPAEAEEVRKAAESIGLRIHSVLRGSAAFNSQDRSQVDQSYAVTEDALRSAAALGADAVLLVPCRVDAHTPGGSGQKGGLLMPRPWEFQIEFDERTGHVRRVVAGDNAPYSEYIRAQNHAVDASVPLVARLIPLAERLRVVIALENVWNNLWPSPAYFQHFVASFQSPWVRAYYDIGNHVKYSRPEEWILTLGPLLAKVHVKDYWLDPADPDGQGRFVNLREGSVRWPIVRTALDQVGYNGWMTIEAPIDLTLAEQAARLSLIRDGK